jgi:hypothetical protein
MSSMSNPIPQKVNKRKNKQTTQNNKTIPKNNAITTQPKTSVAAAYARGQRTNKPKVMRNSVNSCFIKHRELVGSTISTTAFTATTYSINPGLQGTFPWLSIEAQGWEKYKFRSLKLCSYTRTGSNTSGSIILAADYDAADAAPTNEQITSSYYGTVEDAPWKDICFIFDPARLAGERFLRTGALAANLDIKTYDVANTYICTLDATSSGTNWSKLWWEYEVELINPQLPTSGPSGSGTILAGATGLTAATPYGDTNIVTGSYNLSCTASSTLTWSGLTIGTKYILSSYTIGTTLGSAISNSSMLNGTVATSRTIVNTAANTAIAFLTFTATAASGSINVSLSSGTITSSASTLAALIPSPTF